MSEPTPDVKSVFGKALELPSATERAAYLDAACAGHPARRAEVDALLQALDRAGDFLNAPSPNATPSHPDPNRTGSLPPANEKPGTTIAGRYKLLQQIGEGGMGAVWMADQTEPVKRRVAVKLIRADRGASRTILTRFEAERQAIALMNHPNIAKLLDAGTTDDGSPFFVMELVKGVPLTDYCDAHKLSVLDRLTLFRQICSAVHHAHQKGVIHRDLKPTNILVESHDGEPVPKVIDFGLAKATTGMQLTEHTLFTGYGNVMGTPLYMAPEQATFNALDVDSRADIYALGVILYELLSGSTPIHRDTLKTAALDEMLRVVREQEPPPPSSRIGTSEMKPAIAANRGSEATKLGRFVRGELDWIVMKALAKERDRRYESATAFAADVERFLAHEPVTAGPPSQWYRLRKFVRRNKGRVVTASLVVFVLVAGIVGTSLGLVVANRAKEVARAEEEKALVALDEKEEAFDRERAGKEAVQAALGSERQAAYDMTIPLAQQALQENDDARAADLLASCPTELRGWEWNFLSRHLDRGGLTLRPGFIMARNRFSRSTYRFSPDAKTAVFMSQYSAGFLIQVWDTQTGEQIGSWDSESKLKGIWRRFELDPTGKVLAVWSPFISESGKAKVDDPTAVLCLDVRTGTELYRLTGHTSVVSHVAFHPDGARIATGSRDHTIRIWGPGGKEQLVLTGHQANNVLPLAFLPGKNQLLSIGRQYGMNQWPGKTRPTKEDQTPLRYTPDPEELKVWDLDTKSAVLDVTLPAAERTKVCGETGARVSPSGRYAVISDEEIPNALIDLTTGKQPLDLLRTHEIVGVDATETRALCYTSAMVVCEVDIATGRTEKMFRMSERPDYGTIGIATGRSGETRSNIHKQWTVSLTPDGRRLVLGNAIMGNKISVLDVATGRAVRTVPYEANRSSQSISLVLSPDGKKFLTANSTGLVTLWDVDRPPVAAEVLKPDLEKSGWAARPVAVSPDGGQLTVLETRRVTGPNGRSDSEHRWSQLDVKTGARSPGGGLWGHPNYFGLIHSPDGTRIGALLHDTVRIRATDNLGQLYIPVEFDRRTGEQRYLGKEYIHRREQLRDESRYAPHIAYTPEGILLCSNYRPADKTEKVGRWVIEDVATEKARFTIPDPAGRALRLAPGGRYAALFGRTTDAKAIEVWDVVEGKKVWDEPNDSAEPRDFIGQFTPDGKRLLTFEQRLASNQLSAAGIMASTPLATVWNSATGSKVSSFRPPARTTLSGTQMTPDGERFLFSNGDRDHAFTVLFNASTGRQLLSLTEFDQWTNTHSGVFTPDGRYMTHGNTSSAEEFAKVYVWDGSPWNAEWKAANTVDDWLGKAGRLVNADNLPPKKSEEGLALTRRAVDAYPEEYECWKMRGLALLGAGQNQEAQAAFTRASELAKHYPPNYLAQNHYLLALAQYRLNRSAEARTAFESGESEVGKPYAPPASMQSASWTSVPIDNGAQRPKALRYRAAVAAVFGLPPRPLPPERSETPDRFLVATAPHFRLLRAAEVAKRGDHATAVQLTEEALKEKLNPGGIYNAACAYSLAAGAVRNDPELQEKYAVRAVELLNRTLADGLVEFVRTHPEAFSGSPPKHLKQDRDLDTIRDRDDFKKLLAELEIKCPPRDVAPPPRPVK